MLTKHPIEDLYAAIPEVEPYPKGVVTVPARLKGQAFFPGGAGLWDVERDTGLPPMPVGGVMVLGQDFYSEESFAQLLAAGANAPKSATWHRLLELLNDVGISLDRCFFTNAYMGLRQGSGNTGRFPGSRDPAFVDRCRKFLLRQLSTQKPSVVLALGSFVPLFLAPLSPQLRQWESARTLTAVDIAGPVAHEVTFSGSDAPACSIVALTHPSMRGSNVHRRRFEQLSGREAELAMIHEALGNSLVTRHARQAL